MGCNCEHSWHNLPLTMTDIVICSKCGCYRRTVFAETLTGLTTLSEEYRSCEGNDRTIQSVQRKTCS